jgi:hypothetical protein
MPTITIPKKLIKEKKLIVISKKQYEELLRKTRRSDDDKEWQTLSKKNFLRFYNASDSIYDRI